MNNIQYSYDGIYWRSTNTLIFSTAGNYIYYGGTGTQKWVASGQGTNTLATSNNGITWSGLGLTPFTTLSNFSAYGNGTWVAGGQGSFILAYSLNNAASFTGNSTFTSFSVGNGGVYSPTLNRWVVVGSGTTEGVSIAYGSNGINFNVVTGSTGIFTTANKVAWNGTYFMAVGSGDNSIASSLDGINWQGLGTPIITNAQNVIWAGDKWIVVGSSTEPYNPTLMYSYSPSGTGSTGSWVNLGNNVISSLGYAAAWNGSQGDAIIPTNTVILNTANRRKLEVVSAPYNNSGFDTMTITLDA